MDLGAAPGGWTQVAVEKEVGEQLCDGASDILPMDTFADVTFIHGDFTEGSGANKILEVIGKKSRPCNFRYGPQYEWYAFCRHSEIYVFGGVGTGLGKNDYLLRPGGTFTFKVFSGEGFDAVLSQTYREQTSRRW